jgi:hypothetical protein
MQLAPSIAGDRFAFMELIEIHVAGPAGETAQAADRLMKAAEARGYGVRVGPDLEGIGQGDGWFGLDFGPRGKAEAEEEIREIIDELEGGALLSIEVRDSN